MPRNSEERLLKSNYQSFNTNPGTVSDYFTRGNENNSIPLSNHARAAFWSNNIFHFHQMLDHNRGSFPGSTTPQNNFHNFHNFHRMTMRKEKFFNHTPRALPWWNNKKERKLIFTKYLNWITESLINFHDLIKTFLRF